MPGSILITITGDRVQGEAAIAALVAILETEAELAGPNNYWLHFSDLTPETARARVEDALIEVVPNAADLLVY